MAVKSGAILHDANGFVVDRIQTAGVGNLNIPEEKIYEVGNWHSVGTVRDIPDLSFDMESLDVSTEIEGLLTNQVGATPAGGFDFIDAVPMDIISPFKSAQGAYNIIRGLVIPYLTLENVTYRFGTRQNATQSYTLRGDSYFAVPGTPYYQTFAGAGAGPYTLAHTAIPYEWASGTRYALGVCVLYADGTYKRLFFGSDYTNTATAVTITDAADAPGGSTVRVVYGSATPANYLQSVHEGTDIKPAAVRGKDIDVYIGTAAATPTFSRWTGVQSFEVSRRVNLDNDEEFGNDQYVAQDYDTADVTGSITVRPRDVTDLWDKIHQVANVPSNEVVGPFTSVTLPVELRINNPETGDRIKTLYIDDARFQIPPMQPRVQTKLEVTFSFTSEEGNLLVFNGER